VFNSSNNGGPAQLPTTTTSTSTIITSAHSNDAADALAARLQALRKP